jgi:hypothetical protein
MLDRHVFLTRSKLVVVPLKEEFLSSFVYLELIFLVQNQSSHQSQSYLSLESTGSQGIFWKESPEFE